MTCSMMDLQYTFKPEILTLFQCVGVQPTKYTFSEAVQFLRKYVTMKNLLDPRDPTLVTLGNDPLVQIFKSQTNMFDLKDPSQKKQMMVHLAQQLNHVVQHPASSSQVDASPKLGSLSQGIKRKLCNTDFDEPASPMYLYIPPSPVIDSGEETSTSLQEYPTDVARNSEDVCDSDFSQDSFLAPFKRYEVNDMGSDVPFWADGSSGNEQFGTSSDPELALADHWECPKCHMTNQPPMGRCLKCLSPRAHWFPDPRRKKKKRLSRKDRRRNKQLRDMAAESSQPDSGVSSRGTVSDLSQSSSSQTSNPVQTCLICCNRPVNALIVHHRTAHEVCCYNCAYKLQKGSKTCPLCRKTIDRVNLLL